MLDEPPCPGYVTPVSINVEMRPMRKLVLTGICVLAGALALACSSSDPNQGADFDHGTGGASSGTGGASSGGSGGAGTQTAPYPDGPFGYKMGSIIGPDQTFEGWDNPVKAGFDANNFQKIHLSDFYDPDGSKGIKLIMLNVSARWCTVCQSEYLQMEQDGTAAKYKAKGVQFFGVIFEDLNQAPAKPDDLVKWTKAYQVSFPMVLDPSFWFGHFFTADATPMNLVIDASNMKIVGQVLGGDTTTLYNTIDSELAKKQ